jgi:hypothetical protein
MFEFEGKASQRIQLNTIKTLNLYVDIFRHCRKSSVEKHMKPAPLRCLYIPRIRVRNLQQIERTRRQKGARVARLTAAGRMGRMMVRWWPHASKQEGIKYQTNETSPVRILRDS